MLYSPEVADITQEFEEKIMKQDSHISGTHHFDSECSRSHFAEHKWALGKVFEKAGNPFSEDSQDLYTIDDSRRCASEDVKKTVMNIERLGIEQYETFCRERLELRTVSIHAPIKQNRLPTFGYSPKTNKQVSKEETQIKVLKSEANHFSRMCVAIKSNRPNDIDEFFEYEDQRHPPALFSNDGIIHGGNKALLMNKNLLPLVEVLKTAPDVHVKLLDGGAVIHVLRPSSVCVTFSDFVESVFLPFIRKQCEPVSRLDVVWDR